MRPRRACVITLVLFLGTLVLPVPQTPFAADSPKLTSDPQFRPETLTQMLQDMQALAQLQALNPEQRAEIKSLMSQTRLLRQKLHNSAAFPSHYRKKVQEIKLRLDAIKNTLPPRPNHIKGYRTAIV